MLKESYQQAATDKTSRALREAIVDAERLLDALQIALAQDGNDLLSKEEVTSISNAMDTLKALCSEQDHRKILDATASLNTLTEPFAARRMDASVKKALAGQNLDALNL